MNVNIMRAGMLGVLMAAVLWLGVGQAATISVGAGDTQNSTDNTALGVIEVNTIITDTDSSISGEFIIDATHLVDNAASYVVTVEEGGTLTLNSGGEYENSGITVIDSGGTVNLEGTAKFGNSGEMEFAAGAIYKTAVGVTFTNQGTLTVNTGIDGIGDLLTNMQLKSNTGRLILEGHTTNISNTLDYKNAADGTNVALNTVSDDITGGLYTGIVHVGNATLDIWSSNMFLSTVKGASITVGGSWPGDPNFGPMAIFKGAVSAMDISSKIGTFTVNQDSSALFTGSGVMDDGTVIVDAGGTLLFDSGGRMQTAQTVTNNGTIRIAVGGRYVSSGAVTNNNFLSFESGSIYTNSDGITNAANSEMFVDLGTLSYQDLFADTTLRADSTLTVTATENTGFISGSVSLAAAAGSDVVFASGRNGISFSENATFDAIDANITLGEGRFSLADDSELTTAAGSFTAGAGSVLTFIDKPASASTDEWEARISAKSASFSGTHVTNVTKGNTLHFNTASTADAERLSYSGTSSVHIGDDAHFIHADTGSRGVIFNSGTSITLGKNGTYVTDGPIDFAGGTEITITATNTDDMSRIISETGDITVSSSGTTYVTFNGRTQDIIGQIFLHAETGVVNDYELLNNALYIFDITTAEGGVGVIVSGIRSMDEIMDNAFGPDYSSINKENGGNYVDDLISSGWDKENPDLLDYIQRAADPNLGAEQSFIAIGQLYGEYAAYAKTPLMSSSRMFQDVAGARLAIYRNRLARCNVCTLQVVPSCDACGGSGTTYLAGNSIPFNGGGREFWASGLGDWERLGDRENLYGYAYDGAGVAMGLDYYADRFALGFAAGYTQGTLDVNGMSTAYESDILHFAVNASYTLDNHLYVAGNVGFSHGWNEYEVAMLLGGRKDGEYLNQSYAAGLEIGANLEFGGGFHFIPSVGLDYQIIRQDGWTEALAPAASASAPLLANVYEGQTYQSLEIPVGFRLNRVFDTNYAVLAPEVRAAYIYQAADGRASIRSGFAGAAFDTVMYGVNRSRHRGLLGAGLTATFADVFDMSLDYDYIFSAENADHQLQGSLGIKF